MSSGEDDKRETEDNEQLENICLLFFNPESTLREGKPSAVILVIHAFFSPFHYDHTEYNELWSPDAISLSNQF